MDKKLHPQFAMEVVTYPCWDLNKSMVAKGHQGYKYYFPAWRSLVLNNIRWQWCQICKHYIS